MANPRLYGLSKTNRSGNHLWGKNQFNSSFPASLACLMRDKKINAVYLSLDKNLNVVSGEIPIEQLFNCDAKNEEISFLFETKYEPYQKYAFDDIKGIDLVIKHEDRWCRPLEVKLTVIPDQTTFSDTEENWSSELVIRPATTSYCALGMFDSCVSKNGMIRDIIEPVCHDIQHWDSKIEIQSKQIEILSALNNFQIELIDFQKPFLMQPIWKTQGKSPILSDNAFDIFIWSDFALCRTFLDRSINTNNEFNRFYRSSARLAKILYELSTTGKTHLEKTYAQMTFGLQTDKEFALSGRITKPYMNSERRVTPILSPSVLKELILDGGQKKLSPERRFDQTIYYTTEGLFDNLI